jgi:hypothetical protein
MNIIILQNILTSRDVFWQGTCDDGSYALADALGWGVSTFISFSLILWRFYPPGMGTIYFATVWSCRNQVIIREFIYLHYF